MTLAARIRRWRPFRNPAGTVLGYLDVELPSGMVINGSKLMVGPNGKYWVAMPSERQLDRDGNPRLDANGKQLWSPIVEFATRDARGRFSELILEALRRQHPAAFDPTVLPP
jgi:DNA-binding cell septation regulator SpoVG